MIESMRNDPADPHAPDLWAFEDLFKQYWSFVYRILYRMLGDPDEAQDLALETFHRLYQQGRYSVQGFQPGGWLYRVATRLGLRAMRSWKRRQAHEMYAGRLMLEEAPDSQPAQLQLQAEEQALARQALSAMDGRHAQLLILRYSGCSYREIAQAMGLSPTSIGPLLVRAEREFEKVYRALAPEER